MKVVKCTVVFLLSPDRKKVCMGEKTKLVGIGRKTGPGGKLEPNEDLLQCATRETYEEISVTVFDLEKVAIVTFINPDIIREVHFYLCDNFSGTPNDSSEMINVQWFNIDELIKNIHQAPIMAGDKYFLPTILSGKKIVGKCIYTDTEQKTVEYWESEKVPTLD